MDMDRITEKLNILADAAKYDVSCASSGSKRENKDKGLGNASNGICHSYTEDGRCVSLLKYCSLTIAYLIVPTVFRAAAMILNAPALPFKKWLTSPLIFIAAIILKAYSSAQVFLRMLILQWSGLYAWQKITYRV
jgi:hypothetical protein